MWCAKRLQRFSVRKLTVKFKEREPQMVPLRLPLTQIEKPMDIHVAVPNQRSQK
jgi:hypothetical protein